MRLTRGWAVSLWLSAACLLSCGESSPAASADEVCAPGQSSACVCVGGAPGAQLCGPDRQSWLECRCDDVSNGNDTPDVSDAGPPQGMDTSTADVDASPPVDDGRPPNIILLISDDLGLDSTECYAVRNDVASTPNIRALCERGVVFENAWSMPICSPTRAAMLTGRYPHRTGVGGPSGGDNPGIQPDEVTLPRILDARPELGYSHANIGKWHLSSRGEEGNGPNEMGWGHFSGILSGAVQNFFNWRKVVNGQERQVDAYATTELVDDAIEWVSNQEGPFFLWMAFNAPHSPFHAPPAGLHQQNLSGEGDCPAGEDLTCYRAAIEAMDSEIGRLLSSIPQNELDRTYIIYLGDNGTPGDTAQSPFGRTRAKNSLYEGGAHVPFVVAGPGVVDGGRRLEAIIDVTDVFASVLELAGVDDTDWVPEGRTIDSVSFVPYLSDPTQTPLRQWAMSQLLLSIRGTSNLGMTVRDERYKLIRFLDGPQEFYDLGRDPFESEDLLPAGLTGEAAQSFDRLGGVLDEMN